MKNIIMSFGYGLIGGIIALIFTHNIYIAIAACIAGILPDIKTFYITLINRFGKKEIKLNQYDSLHTWTHSAYLSFIIPASLITVFVWLGQLQYAFIPFSWLLHILLDSVWFKEDTGKYIWWSWGIQALILVAAFYYYYNSPFIAVLFFILLASVVDFQKDVEVYRVGWKNINPKYLHNKPYRWHIKIISIWVIPILVLSFWDERFLYGLILFWLEDLFYYTQRLINYGTFLPKTLNHLVADKFTLSRNWFIALMSVQILLFAIIVFL